MLLNNLTQFSTDTQTWLCQCNPCSDQQLCQDGLGEIINPDGSLSFDQRKCNGKDGLYGNTYTMTFSQGNYRVSMMMIILVNTVFGLPTISMTDSWQEWCRYPAGALTSVRSGAEIQKPYKEGDSMGGLPLFNSKHPHLLHHYFILHCREYISLLVGQPSSELMVFR